MASVLLGVAGLDALDADPEPQPPHRELAQAEDRGRGEGMAVVGADCARQAKVLKSPFKHGKCVDLLGGLQGIAAQKIATGKVGDRERKAIALIRLDWPGNFGPLGSRVCDTRAISARCSNISGRHVRPYGFGRPNSNGTGISAV